MTDTPGREPGEHELEARETEPEQRLPVPRPPVEPAPLERFTSTPSTRTFELTPERSAQVVRQSSNARWVGFLAVVVVILFVAIYWFYELGAPLGATTPRLDAEAASQQVTKVERGYLLYQANCARCHGDQGQGGIGPILNSQEKLFAHLNEGYIRNMLAVGGRFACGNADSIMPTWADDGRPPGPLNYRQIDELVAFLMATNEDTYTVRDEHLYEPKLDPVTGVVLTFTGWRDPTYMPAPDATPYPACWADSFATPSSGASAGPSSPPAATILEISASSSTAFDETDFTVPADEDFQIHFQNNEAGVPHNVEVKDSSGATLVRGDIITGVAEATYDVAAVPAGTYPFACSVHPNMIGTITAE
jgi:mono/diheme cytochrome c family protein/plastocyanin